MKLKALLLSRYTEAGSTSRYRSFKFLPYLERLGIEVTVAPLLSDLYIERLYDEESVPVFDVSKSFIRRIIKLRTLSDFDLIWLEGEAFPWLPYWLESFLFRSDVPYVVDYDDALFHRYDKHRSGLVRTVYGSKIDHVMAKSALVIAGNKYLAERANSAGANRIEIIPTLVDSNQYPSFPMPHNDIYTIGWIGSLSTAKYLMSIEEALKIFCKECSAKLVTVGIRRLELQHVPVAVIQPWSEAAEVEQLRFFDVGIMPLVDSWWERGKCGHKLIKYMSCGRPVIASPIGVNTEIVEHGVNGFLVSTRDEWIGALTYLKENREVGERMGQAGRKKVELRYSYDAVAPRLANLFREIARVG